MTFNKSKLIATAVATTMGVASINAADVNITANITSNATWTNSNVYILTQEVYVEPGASLTIEPGTLVLAEAEGALIVTDGAQLFAEGTAQQPIIFTSDDDRNGTNLAGENGQWGGVIILGSAPINFFVDPGDGGPDENRERAEVEGVVPGADSDDDGLGDLIEYGGMNVADNSGVIRYVSIRFGGKVLSANNEINGLTLAGVGNGTTIDHVEVVNNTDDGIEFFGGTVNTSYMVMAFNEDEQFDMDQGHAGIHQFWFGIRDEITSENGLELDGGDGSLKTGEPLTNTKVYNMTMIGGGDNGGNDAFRMKDNFAGQFHNSYITDFAGSAIRIDDAPTRAQVGTNLLINNTTFGKIGSATQNSSAEELALYGGTGNTPINASGNDLIRSIPGIDGFGFRDADGSLDPRPTTGSSLLSDGTTALADEDLQTALAPVSYRGAFDACDNWLKNWTWLDQAGYLAGDPIIDANPESAYSDLVTAGTIVEVPTTAIVAGDWTNDKIYVLTGETYVTGNLDIEAGTRIFSQVEGALIVTDGATINATGTKEQPILFSSIDQLNWELGEPGSVKPQPGDNGKWGGIIILGSAPINFFVDPGDGGPDENRERAEVEGVVPGADSDDDGLGDLIEYGGMNVADNSGVFQYVSIRYGGKVLSANNEINGLTLGGVGNGTTIDHVEVVNNTDDGIEFFGGTVNTSYMVMAFNEDEQFDMDQGHQGVHQFWFGIRDAVTSENGLELDGGDGSLKTGEPLTSTKIYNMTMIGGGDGGGNDAFRMKDNFAGQFHNSFITDFDGSAIRIDDAPTEGQVGTNLLINNTTFGKIGSATQNSSAAELALYGGTGNTPLSAGGNGLIRSIPGVDFFGYRLPNGLLDPRPTTTGDLLTGNTTTPDAASLAQGAIATNYRGAFADENWLCGWTFLSQEGYLSEQVKGIITVVAPTEAFASLPVIINSATGAFSFEKAAGSPLTFTVQYSDSLLGNSWQAVTPVQATVDESADPVITVTPTLIGDKLFFRVIAEEILVAN